MAKLSEVKDRMFLFLYCPGEKAIHYYESESYIKCPEDLPDSQYLSDFNNSEHFDVFEEFIMELTLEVENEIVIKSLFLEFLEYIEHSFRDHFLQYEPFNNNKQRFDSISSIVVDFLDCYLMEVGQFLYHSRILLKKLIPSPEFNEHTLFNEVNEGEGKKLRLKNDRAKIKAESVDFDKMFKDPKDLRVILDLLNKENYCELDPIKWAPIYAGGNETEHKFLSAFYSHILNNCYLKKSYPDKDVAIALSKYFNFKLSAKTFGSNKKDSNFKNIVENYFFIPKKVK